MTSIKKSTFYQLGGYPGLHYMAEQISEFFPDSPIHVEPFAGLGRTIPYTKTSTVYLNDLSDYAISYLKENYPTSIVTQEDFRDYIKKYRENPDVFMFLDPPWRKNIYKNHTEPVFNMKNVTQYYIHIFALLNDEVTKCKWMLCSDKARTEIGVCIKNTGYYTKFLEHPKRQFYNKPVGVQLVANYPF